MALLTTLILASAAQSARFNPELSTFDGQNWGGLRFERDKDADIKKQFRTVKGPIRPEALLFETVDGTQINALLKGRGAKATLIGFTYQGPRMDVSDLGKMFSGQWGETFPRVRFEDVSWRMNADKGVAALVAQDGNVEVAVLSDSRRIRSLMSQTSSRKTPIEDIEKMFEAARKEIQIGSITATATVADLPGVDQRRFERDIRNAVDDFRYPDFIRANSSYAGNINATVRLDYNTKRDRTEATVSVSIQGETGWGKVSRSASNSTSRSGRGMSWREVETTLEDTIDAALQALRNDLRNLRPPAPRVITLLEATRAINESIK